MKPSVGRIVHYVDGGACRAALVTDVAPGSAWIAVCAFDAASLSFRVGVTEHPGFELKPGETRERMCGERDYAPETWHWPARVD